MINGINDFRKYVTVINSVSNLLHTILNVLTCIFEINTGEVDMGCDNKDNLCKQNIKQIRYHSLGFFDLMSISNYKFKTCKNNWEKYT